MSPNILWLHDLRLTDLAQVGGKNSSLGEMIGNLAKLGVSVPGGYATTADAFKAFIAHNDLHQRIFDRLATLDVEDVPALTKAGGEIRGCHDGHRPLVAYLPGAVPGVGSGPERDHPLVDLVGGVEELGDLGRLAQAQRQQAGGERIQRTEMADLAAQLTLDATHDFGGGQPFGLVDEKDAVDRRAVCGGPGPTRAASH